MGYAAETLSQNNNNKKTLGVQKSGMSVGTEATLWLNSIQIGPECGGSSKGWTRDLDDWTDGLGEVMNGAHLE